MYLSGLDEEKRGSDTVHLQGKCTSFFLCGEKWALGQMCFQPNGTTGVSE